MTEFNDFLDMSTVEFPFLCPQCGNEFEINLSLEQFQCKNCNTFFNLNVTQENLTFQSNFVDEGDQNGN